MYTRVHARSWIGAGLAVATICVVVANLNGAPEVVTVPAAAVTVRTFGAVGDGKTDDSAAVQAAVDYRAGAVRFPRGVYRLTKTIQIELDRDGPTSITADGTARIVMDGPGPAFRLIGTHEGTASPDTFQENVWENQRSPMIDGLEIVGDHPEASGIQATGTMQLTITRLVVRKALHGIHLIQRNRNLIISNCHIYENKGAGIYYDRVNLHQSNISGCHVSYNEAGGIVVRGGDVRNIQIVGCDIEGNMGEADSPATANVLLDSTGGSIGEVAIVGCTIQHSHEAANSANIRVLGQSLPRPFTEETRHGNITIADNVLSDVQVNIDVAHVRGMSITGNTVWKGYAANLRVEHSDGIVMSDNVFDRNPRYHYGDGSSAALGIVLANCHGCTISGNHIDQVGDIPAAMVLRGCSHCNITGCTILDSSPCGLLLADVSHSRVSDCLIRDGHAAAAPSMSLRVTGGAGNMIVDNSLGAGYEVAEGTSHLAGNYSAHAKGD